MSASPDEDSQDNQIDWDELKRPINIDTDFEKLWSKRLSSMIQDSDRKAAEVSGFLKSSDRDLIGKFLRGEKHPNRRVIRWLSRGLAALRKKSQASADLNAADLIEIELSLAAGLLPRHTLELKDYQGSHLLMPALRDIINVAYLVSRDTQQDLRSTEYWLGRFSGQMKAWLALINFTQRWRHAEEWHEIEELWNEIQQNWDSMHAEQRGWAAILRAQTLKLRGLTHDALGFLEFAQEQFPDENKNALRSPTDLIRYNLYTTWGDAYRELGRLEDTMAAYDHAIQYASEPIDGFRIQRKRLDAYTRVSQFAPLKLRQELEDAVRSRRFAVGNDTYPLSSVEYAHTCFALAWLWRDQGMGTVDRSKNYLHDGIRALEQADPTEKEQAARVLKIGYQYYADTLIRAGEFEQAIQEVLREDFSSLHYARRAFSKFIHGRALFYEAFSQGSMPLIDDAVAALEGAEELYSLLGTNHRRVHVLNELAKFYSVRQVLRMDPQSGQKDVNAAFARLDLAEMILKSLGVLTIHTQPAVDVNRAMITFLEWITDPKKKSDRKQTNELRKRIEGLNSNLQVPHALLGHQARGHAISAAFSLATAGLEQRNSEWKRRVLTNVRHSASMANDRDYLTLYDCRWLISLGTERSRIKDYLPSQNVMDVYDEYSNGRLKGKPLGTWSDSTKYSNLKEPE